MAKKKQQGGYLKGPKHSKGGIPAIIAGQELVELEGGEYIVKASTVDKVGKKGMDTFNKTGHLPKMRGGGSLKPYASIPPHPRFPKDVRMMGHGGQVSTSNDKTNVGDIHTTHSHSGYKAGE